MDDSLRGAVARFFDEFVEAFATFDGDLIAQRYRSPYVALHVDGATDCFTSHADIGRYFQKVVNDYHAKGCHSCRYKDLEVVPLGKASALGTVTWELINEDGSLLSSWRESYTLYRVAESMKVVASVDHAG